MYKDYKVGDKFKVIKLENEYRDVEIGSIHTIVKVDSVGYVYTELQSSKEYPFGVNQIELVQLNESTQFNFITKRQLTEHLQKVITFYEDYTSDLLKETARDYKEDIIDLKETGYEYRLELDKILIQVEERI